MAILINTATGRRIVLSSQHVFGRDRTCSTLLDNTDASRLHASISWTGHRWELRDHSRNGTVLDGRRVPQNVALVLAKGQSLMFGVEDAPRWQVQDLGRPGPLLLPDDGGEPIELARSNLLPERSTATVAIVQESSGQWQCTMEEGARILQDGDALSFGGRDWRFFSGSDGQITQASAVESPPAPLSCSLRFHVSLDEEHVVLRMAYGERAFDMGERTHHYALLTLARLRMDDATRGLSAADQGWVSHTRLAKMLGLEPGHLNIQIFRLRQQVAMALGKDVVPPELIQRRRGELRMGDMDVEVRRGAHTPVRVSEPANSWARDQA